MGRISTAGVELNLLMGFWFCFICLSLIFSDGPFEGVCVFGVVFELATPSPALRFCDSLALTICGRNSWLPP